MCNGSGGCVGMEYICIFGLCEIASMSNGEGCDVVVVVDGASCDDSNFCISADACIEGACAGIVYVCSDC